MNYLAHAYLAEPEPESILGNLMADFVKGRAEMEFSPGIRAGFRLHRKVDAFTDRHPVFQRSQARLRDRWGRFSGILVDMFYDHFLAAEWKRYSDQTLREFADHVYASLDTLKNRLPERMRTAAERMVHYDWLVSYGDPDKLAVSLERLSRRSRKSDLRLERAMADLRCEYKRLRGDFHDFFPELIAFAIEVRRHARD